MARIYLERIFGKNFSVRSTIVSLFNLLESQQDHKITLDFQNVIFMSRSCADEYLKQKDKIDKEIIEENICKDVITMIQVVKSAKKISSESFNPCAKVALL